MVGTRSPNEHCASTELYAESPLNATRGTGPEVSAVASEVELLFVFEQPVNEIIIDAIIVIAPCSFIYIIV